MKSTHAIYDRSNAAARMVLPTVLTAAAAGRRGERRQMLVGLARFPLQTLFSDLLVRWMADRFDFSLTGARPHPAYDLACDACLDKLSSGLSERDLFVAIIATRAEPTAPEQARETDALSTLTRKHSSLQWIARGMASACFNPANGCALATFEAVPGAIALMLPQARADGRSAKTVSFGANYVFARAHCGPGRIAELLAPLAISSPRRFPSHV